MRFRAALVLGTLAAVLVWLGPAQAVTIERRSPRELLFDTSQGAVGVFTGFAVTNDANDPGGLGGTYPWPDATDIWLRLRDVSCLGCPAGATVQLGSGEDGVVHVGPIPANTTDLAFFYLEFSGPEFGGYYVIATLEVYSGRPDTHLLYSAPVEWDLDSGTIVSNANKVLSVTLEPPQPVAGAGLRMTVTGETGLVGMDGHVSFDPAVLADWPADVFELTGVVVAFVRADTGYPCEIDDDCLADEICFPASPGPATCHILSEGLCQGQYIGLIGPLADPCPGFPENPLQDTLIGFAVTTDSQRYRAEYTFRATAGLVPAACCAPDGSCPAGAVCDPGTNTCGTPTSPTAFVRSGSLIKHSDPETTLLVSPPLPPPESFAALSASARPSTLSSAETPSLGTTISILVENASTRPVFLDTLRSVLPPGATVIPGTTSYDGVPIDDPILVEPLAAPDGARWPCLPLEGVVCEAVWDQLFFVAGGSLTGATCTLATTCPPDPQAGCRDAGGAEVAECVDDGSGITGTCVVPGTTTLTFDVALACESGVASGPGLWQNLHMARADLGHGTIDATHALGDDTPAVASVTVYCCGDGFPAGPEQCDDGNTDPGDGCNATCEIEGCGDGIVQPMLGEECDDGGDSVTCDGDCTYQVCGDAWLNTTAGEQCDDGGDSVTCDGDCTYQVCGDAWLNATAGEECDDGGDSPTCDGDCTTALCGDFWFNAAAGEACDEGPEGSETVCGCQADCDWGTSGTPCDDNDACTESDACDGVGACASGTPLACDDGDACTQDSCDPGSGCVFTPFTGGTLACGVGVCAHEVTACVDGVAQTCDPYEGATAETCDGLDNDCDGDSDEFLSCAVPTNDPDAGGCLPQPVPVAPGEGGAPAALLFLPLLFAGALRRRHSHR